MTHLTKAYGWGTLAALFFIFSSFMVKVGGTEPFDAWIIQRVQGWETHRLTWVMEGFSWIGSIPIVILLVLVTGVIHYIILKHRAELVLLAAAVGGTAIINVLMKLLFRRDRPELYRIVEESGYAYPSGHSVAAVALYGVLTYLLWRHITSRAGKVVLILICIFMTFGIGLSRIYLGVHYPSDVVGGFFMSGCLLALCIEGYLYLQSKEGSARGRKI